MIAKHAALTLSQSACIRRRENSMTFSKILATTTIVGMMGTTAFANDINFAQSSGTIGAVTFTQQGGAGNVISANGLTSAAAATVVGSLATLKMEQLGATNATSFAITTGSSSAGNVAVLLDGSGNTSALAVSQVATDTLSYSVSILGNDNTIDSTISAHNSVVNIESQGNAVDYTIGQTGGVANANNHSITANVLKSGAAAATISLTQSGLSNTITLGTPSAYGAFTGSGGLTLNDGATFSITQSADAASYTAAHTIAAGGSLTIVQAN